MCVPSGPLNYNVSLSVILSNSFYSLNLKELYVTSNIDSLVKTT